MTNREKVVYVLVAFLCLGHFLLGAYAPKQPSPYSFSPVMTVLINLSIVVPYYLSWILGTYAGRTLRATARAMQERDDQVAFSRISAGMFTLTAGLVVTSYFGQVRSYFVGHELIIPALTIITNYIYTLAPLIGFALMYAGSRRLRGAESTRVGTGVMLTSLALIAFAVGYLWLIFTNPTRQFSASATEQASYFLPDSLIVLTIVLPFFASIVLSMLVTQRLTAYYRGVSGEIYKKAAMNFIVGTVFVICSSNVLHIILSAGSARLLSLGLVWLFVIVYAFLGFVAFGFLYLALGVRKLAVIERVMTKYGIKDANR